MIEPVFEKGYPSYEAVNRNEPNLKKTADKTKQLSDFEIESLDPAERSWYYDGDGTRRKKDE